MREKTVNYSELKGVGLVERMLFDNYMEMFDITVEKSLPYVSLAAPVMFGFMYSSGDVGGIFEEFSTKNLANAFIFSSTSIIGLKDPLEEYIYNGLSVFSRKYGYEFDELMRTVSPGYRDEVQWQKFSPRSKFFLLTKLHKGKALGLVAFIAAFYIGTQLHMNINRSNSSYLGIETVVESDFFE